MILPQEREGRDFTTNKGEVLSSQMRQVMILPQKMEGSDITTNKEEAILPQIREGSDNTTNTSLAVLGALAHHLQCRTTCNTSPPALSKMAEGVWK